jgi:hypothetical protein
MPSPPYPDAAEFQSAGRFLRSFTFPVFHVAFFSLPLSLRLATVSRHALLPSFIFDVHLHIEDIMSPAAADIDER